MASAASVRRPGERRRAAPPAKARRAGAGRACGGRPWRGARLAERAGGGAGGAGERVINTPDLTAGWNGGRYLPPDSTYRRFNRR